MRRTIIDLREDGAHVVPDMTATGVWHYDDDMMLQAGAIPEVECPDHDTEEHNIMAAAASAVETAHRAAMAEGLGAYFDAVLQEGFEWALAQKLLHIAFRNLNERKRTPERMIRDLYRGAKASSQR